MAVSLKRRRNVSSKASSSGASKFSALLPFSPACIAITGIVFFTVCDTLFTPTTPKMRFFEFSRLVDMLRLKKGRF